VKRVPAVLAIGGFDPSCGAGVVADARSIDAMGALPLAVTTALTVQSGTGVQSFSAVPARHVLAQIDRILADIRVDIVKIGQVPTAALATLLARRLARARLKIVLDPVLEASGGGGLASAGAARAIGSSLLPNVTLLTVNLAEAAVLTGRAVGNLAAMKRAAAELSERGAHAVLIKGGHLRGDPIDVLRIGERDVMLRGKRLQGSMHGTGCALASAAAARMACGDDIETAVRRGREHVRSLLKGAVRAGRGRLRSPGSY
jgi:hydroxymethylpyrimidine/phosphomethylpyrimidine kinase